MKKLILILATVATVISYSGQSSKSINNTIMDNKEKDKLDFVLLDKFAKKVEMKDDKGIYFAYDWTFIENGTETRIFGNKRRVFTMWQTPPKPAFFQIYKQYYPNGYLKLKGKCMGDGITKIGEWEYYNEKGELTSKVDEDKKFGKFGYNELLLFLHQEKYIDIKTGENRENVRFGYNVENKEWGVRITKSSHWITEYVIDGETGAVINKKEYQGGKR